MATNVDFFRAFCADTTYKDEAYYFEHSREELDYSNLFDADSAEDSQVKCFHYTQGIDPLINESGGNEGRTYRGTLVFILKSDFDGVIDVQQGVGVNDGKYTKHVKDLIQGAESVAEEIAEYNYCNDGYDLSFTNMRELYNFMDVNGDGVIVDYELTIRI